MHFVDDAGFALLDRPLYGRGASHFQKMIHDSAQDKTAHNQQSLIHLTSHKFGWSGRTRTFTLVINSDVPYQLDHAPKLFTTKIGWESRTRTCNLGFQKPLRYQLRHLPKAKLERATGLEPAFPEGLGVRSARGVQLPTRPQNLVTPARFELATSSFGGKHSYSAELRGLKFLPLKSGTPAGTRTPIFAFVARCPNPLNDRSKIN